MNLLIVLIVLLLLFGGLSLPQFSGNWHQFGYVPSVSIGTILLIIVVFMLLR